MTKYDVFPPDNVVINGVFCKDSLFSNAQIYENGGLKKWSPAEECHVVGNKYKKGETIEMDENGKIKEGT